MALRSSSPDTPNHPGDPVDNTPDAQDTLNASPSQRAVPESNEKRITAAILTVIIIGAMFAPWWKTSGELLLQTDHLSGWDLLILGFGIGGYAPLTGFSAFGNVLFGAMTTVPVLIVAALLIVRVIRPRAIPAHIVALWALLALITIGWLMVVGWARLNATLGVFPVTWGALITAMAMAFTAVAMWNWWRRGERGIFPRRGRIRLTSKELDEAEPVEIGDLMDDPSDDGGADSSNGDTSGEKSR
ncbi:hypothetical protein [Gulosibacter molinativorax]|uniref:Tryptophan-rich sensory protein n=1 Tax=Gulosibacter molinativorax TaxID=256821 RepID=A0ABT7C4L3_9MICO|nr:hypothetical protein [Gulosibacter molinativorax]MDJ1369975.1 hypothetical protein [Gulosibacter molinativorax]QUY63835.1 Hypotetical protein [Gulosibacter molinativorax]